MFGIKNVWDNVAIVDYYDRVKHAFERGIALGMFVPKTAQDDIDRLVADGIAVVVKDYGEIVKVVPGKNCK